jgi:hypothetical protein
MHITISHGVCNLLRKEFPDGTTVGSVLADPEVKEHFGFEDNMEARIGGDKMSRDHVLLGDEILIIANDSCEKSARVRIRGDDPYQFYFKQFEPLATEPRHVHVWRDGKEAKFWLEPLELDKSRRCRFAPHELNDIVRRITAGTNLATLINAWNEGRQRAQAQNTAKRR